MGRPWSAVSFAGASVLLVSLYLPWQEAPSSVSDVFAGTSAPSVDGWTTGAAGEAAALSALALAFVAGAAWARPRLEDRLPIRRCALAAGYFAVAVLVGTRSVAQGRTAVLGASGNHFAYGAYLGIAAAVLVLAPAAATGRDELALLRAPRPLVALVVSAALLVAFLLPWERLVAGLPVSGTAPGVLISPATVAAALALLAQTVWWRVDAAGRTAQLALSAAVLLFTSAAVSSIVFPGIAVYGAWIGLGVAIALAAFSVAGSRNAMRPPVPSLAACAAAALFLTGLFLPWRTGCNSPSFAGGPLSGRCVTENGWTTAGAAAALVALALIVVVTGYLAWPVVELVAAFALLAATLGFRLAEVVDADSVARYGAIVALPAAAGLVAVTLANRRPSRPGLTGAPSRAIPIAACVAYVAVVVLPWWYVLPTHFAAELRFGPLSWLTIAGLLLGLHLLGLWVARPGGAELVLAPLALLALAALDLIPERGDGLTWGGGVVVALCLVLTAAGTVELRDGLRKLPSGLRVDRI